MPPRPTDAELAILSALWERGPSTVRQIHESLDHASGYTTTLKLMQIMTDKGLVKRDESQRSHVYKAAVTQEQTQKKFVRELLAKLFNGSSAQLALHALSSSRATPEERAEIRRMLDEAEKRDS